jgi:hypothetical protein
MILEILLSAIEGILITALIWKVFVPTLFGMGNLGILMALIIIIAVIVVEVKSYQKNKSTWIASHILEWSISR